MAPAVATACQQRFGFVLREQGAAFGERTLPDLVRRFEIGWPFVGCATKRSRYLEQLQLVAAVGAEV
jgi:hypothetical protein